jgi:outer membrane protein OmpA-like peptidoglycan-associated protein
MRIATSALLATAALVLPGSVGAQERDVSCDTEVAAFMETLQKDETFPLIEAVYADLEADLVEAVESDEGTCYAILANVQTALRDEGFVVEGASDDPTIDRTRLLARRTRGVEVEEAADTTVKAEASEVAVEPGETEVAVRQPEPEVTVRQSTPDVTVEKAEPDVTIVGPDEEVEVVEEDGGEEVPTALPTDVEVIEEDETRAVETEETREQVEADVDIIEGDVDIDAPDDGGGTIEYEPAEEDLATTARRMRDRDEDEAVDEEIADRIRRFGRLAADTAERGADMDLDEAADLDVSARDAAARDVDLDVEAVAALEAFSVREVEFPFDSATVPLGEAASILADVAALVEEEPDTAVLLTGYASPIGDAAYNLELSEARVEAVRDALVELGVPQPLIRTRSLGERNTEVPAGEGERSPANRRVEIRVLDMSDVAG